MHFKICYESARTESISKNLIVIGIFAVLTQMHKQPDDHGKRIKVMVWIIKIYHSDDVVDIKKKNS